MEILRKKAKVMRMQKNSIWEDEGCYYSWKVKENVLEKERAKKGVGIHYAKKGVKQRSSGEGGHKTKLWTEEEEKGLCGRIAEHTQRTCLCVLAQLRAFGAFKQFFSLISSELSAILVIKKNPRSHFKILHKFERCKTYNRRNTYIQYRAKFY